MTRLSRRGLVRALRAPAPDPPPELGRQLKEQIPEDLFAARATPPASRRRTLRRAPWAVAASVLVALGSGYLALRLFEQRAGGAREQLADLERARATEPAAEHAPATAPVGEVAVGARGQAARRREDQQMTELQAEPHELEREMHALPGTTAELAASPGAVHARDTREADATADREAVELEAIPQSEAPRVRWLEEHQQEVRTELERLRSERGDTASADRSSGGRDPDGAVDYVEVASQPISTLAVTAGQRPSAVGVGAAVTAADRVTMQRILDAAVGPRAASAGDAIEVAGTPTRRPGHLALLLSAILPASDADDLSPVSSIELELDPAVARRYRLLASDTRLLAASAGAPGAPAVDARAASAAPRDPAVSARSATAGGRIPASLYRLTAVFEIELASGRRPGADLGATRLRRGEADAGSAPLAPRPIGIADLARGWDQSPVELRLAILGAELAALPADAPASLLAPIAQEIERLRADTGLEPTAARLAAELAALAARPTGAADQRVEESVDTPARNDG